MRGCGRKATPQNIAERAGVFKRWAATSVGIILPLTAVSRIANESLTLSVNNPIHGLQGELSDEHGRIIIKFNDFHQAVSILNDEAHRVIHGRLSWACGC
jgi:hypothetical protein